MVAPNNGTRTASFRSHFGMLDRQAKSSRVTTPATANRPVEATAERPLSTKNHRQKAIPRTKWGRKNSGKKAARLWREAELATDENEAAIHSRAVPIRITAPKE